MGNKSSSERSKTTKESDMKNNQKVLEMAKLEINKTNFNDPKFLLNSEAFRHLSSAPTSTNLINSNISVPNIPISANSTLKTLNKTEIKSNILAKTPSNLEHCGSIKQNLLISTTNVHSQKVSYALNLPNEIPITTSLIPPALKNQIDKKLNTAPTASVNPSTCKKLLKFENEESALSPKLENLNIKSNLLDFKPIPKKDSLLNPSKTVNFSDIKLMPKKVSIPIPSNKAIAKKNKKRTKKFFSATKTMQVLSDNNKETMSSFYQIKKRYNSKTDFFKTFEYLISLEEKEESKEAKIFYKNESRIYFINENLFKNLIDYFSLLGYFKNVKIMNDLRNKINITEHQRRIAIFIDYNNKIGPKNIKNIAISDEKGNNLEFELFLVFSFNIFAFKENVPIDVKNFNISLKEIESFDKIKKAMLQYITYRCDPVVNSIFLGQITEAKLNFDLNVIDYSANGLFKLNDSQIKAIKNALNYRVSIIQGPPGTGKTQTISGIIYHIDKICRKSNDDFNYSYNHNKRPNCVDNLRFDKYFASSSKILICAASNSPVFDLRRKLTEKGMKVLHVIAKSKEDEYKNDPETLKYKFDKKVEKNDKFQKLIKNFESLKNKNDNQKADQIKDKIYLMEQNIKASIISEYNIICCTTRMLQNSFFKRISFDFAIVDEATQCLEPDIVLCLLKDVKHLVLVGDIHQLGPVIKSQTAKQLGFDVSTIERLQDLGVPLTFLDTQYRMQPFLSKFSSINFYKGQLKDGKLNPSQLKFPKNVKTHGFFYHIKSKEDKNLIGSSILNTIEAEAVINVIKFLRSKNIENKNIGVITFYGGQREYLRGLIMKNNFEDLEIMSVDESQGREKEYVILSCVRSNEHKKVGFLDEYRRLNVAMTRVKNGLVVCGNANTFVVSKLWSQLVYYFQVNNAIFTGDLSNMKMFRVNLKEVKPFVIKRADKYSNKTEDHLILYKDYIDIGE
jgi:superfamily I DNA and/or RNA helicase